ncbi:Sin3 associated polypeptide p18-domain-containing protein [Rhodotorula toruloides]
MNRARPARQPAQRRVDREKVRSPSPTSSLTLTDSIHPQTCPSLLRVFVKTGQHHADTDFTIQHVPSADEHQLYTWRDTTLREIINLVLDSSPRIRTLLIPAVHLHSPNARLSLRIVFFDPSLSRFTSTDLASFSVRDLVSSSNPPPRGRDRSRSPARRGRDDDVDMRD